MYLFSHFNNTQKRLFSRLQRATARYVQNAQRDHPYYKIGRDCRLIDSLTNLVLTIYPVTT